MVPTGCRERYARRRAPTAARAPAAWPGRGGGAPLARARPAAGLARRWGGAPPPATAGPATGRPSAWAGEAGAWGPTVGPTVGPAAGGAGLPGLVGSDILVSVHHRWAQVSGKKLRAETQTDQLCHSPPPPLHPRAPPLAPPLLTPIPMRGPETEGGMVRGGKGGGPCPPYSWNSPSSVHNLHTRACYTHDRAGVCSIRLTTVMARPSCQTGPVYGAAYTQTANLVQQLSVFLESLGQGEEEERIAREDLAVAEASALALAARGGPWQNALCNLAAKANVIAHNTDEAELTRLTVCRVCQAYLVTEADYPPGPWRLYWVVPASPQAAACPRHWREAGLRAHARGDPGPAATPPTPVDRNHAAPAGVAAQGTAVTDGDARGTMPLASEPGSLAGVDAVLSGQFQ